MVMGILDSYTVLRNIGYGNTGGEIYGNMGRPDVHNINSVTWTDQAIFALTC